MMEADFEWDPNKARFNEQKHDISFEEAATVFADPLSLTVIDPRFAHLQEVRYATIGTSFLGRTIVVAHCERDRRIRIISARKPTRTERRTYEEGK